MFSKEFFVNNIIFGEQILQGMYYFWFFFWNTFFLSLKVDLIFVDSYKNITWLIFWLHITMLQKLGHAKVGNKIDKLNKGYKVAYLTLTNYW